MAKYLLIPKSEEEMISSQPYVDGYVFGVKGLSTNFECYKTLDELKPIVANLKGAGKEVLISLNKNMHDCDLEPLKEALKTCEEMKVDGIFFYDLSILKLKQDGWFTLPLIWNQEHMTTNYQTCHFYQKQGVEMVSLSSEITLDEILEISQHTDMKRIVPIFGYLPMFVSKRNLVKNYIDRFQLSKTGSTYEIKKEGYTYPIINDETGTEVYSAYILNGMEESLVLKDHVDYFLFSSFHIETKTMIEVLKSYRSLKEENVTEMEEKIDRMLKGNTDKGFFYKETVFRVKK